MPPTEKPGQPSWWTAEHTAGWESARAAMKESWAQQAKGEGDSAWTAAEPAVRFGHGARHHYDASGKASWDELEPSLEADWSRLQPTHPWRSARPAVLHGWNSHTRAKLHANSQGSGGAKPSGLGSSDAGDSGSGSGGS